MKIHTILFTLLTLTSTPLKAENYMSIMGGGGEPQGPKTMFDSTMKLLGANLKELTNWKTEVSFNGGHSETEAILYSYPGLTSAPTRFTEENFKRTISGYKARILMGDIKASDQIVIMVNTHGAEKVGKEKTHQIAVSGGRATNLNNLSGSKVVSMDELEELVKLTNERGIKLGIIDLSCHSGNTMALKKNAPNTCIITSTGPKHFGFSGADAFTGTLAKNIKKGSTMEMAFLNARAQSNDASFAMISTEENDAIVAEVYALITPYLYFHEVNADKLTDYILNNSKDCITCTRETEFKALIDKINKLKNASLGQKNGFNAEELKRLLTNYKSQQDDLINKARRIGVGQGDKQETFSTPVTLNGRKIRDFALTYKVSDILSTDFDSTIKSVTALVKSSKSAIDKAETEAALATWLKLKQRKDELVRNNPGLKSAESEAKELIKGIGENRATAEAIALQEKKFYDELYREKQSLNVDDPCRKIVF